MGTAVRSCLVLLAVAFAAVSACRRGSEAPDDSITVLYDADERLFGPYCSCNSWFLVFLPLVTWDGAGAVAPRLAQRWESSADARHWTFYLRSDVRWHDGVPTTAHDVKFTIEFQGRPDIRYEDAWHDVDSILVHDDTTLSIHYARPTNALNEWVVYWPKHILEHLDPADFWEWEFWTRPVGNGPYRYVRHVPMTMVELQANPDFYAGKPAIEHVRIKFGGRDVAVTELLSGNVDVLTSVDQATLLALAHEPQLRAYHQLHPGVPWINVIAWNHRHPALSDRRVRRALTLGLDRTALRDVLGVPKGACLGDVPFTPRQCRQGRVPEAMAFDPDRAVGLLAEAGWVNTAADGVLARDGQRLSFTVLVSSDEEETVAVFAQAAFRKIGIDLEVQRLDRQARVQRLMAGEFAAAVLPFWNATDGHIQWFGAIEPENRLRGFPDIGYRNVAVRHLLAAAKNTVDPDGRDRVYEALAPLMLADLPILFLYPQQVVAVAPQQVRGLEMPHRADPIGFMERLWIER